MRLTTLLMLACMLNISANVLPQQFSFHVKGESIKDVLAMIETTSDYKFLYRTDIIDVTREVELNIRKENINSILSKLFDSNTTTYKIFEDNLVVITTKSMLQQLNVTGTVTDGTTGEPLIGVTIQVMGTMTGTISQADGSYSVNIPPEAEALIFSFVGYITQEIPINNRSVIDVIMEEGITALDEVVIVGYGTQRKVNLTGAVASIGSKELGNRPITQASQAIQGKMAGVTVTQNFGTPGSDMGTIRIRGIGTIGDNSPLILIDGIEGDINTINPQDIENISVLKDAASSSIYGSRAANGVILVTTKRGSQNEDLQITYSGLFAAQLPTNIPKTVDGVTYMTLKNENENNNGRVDLYSESYIEEYISNAGKEPYFNTNWYDAIMKNQAMEYQHAVTVRGGTERISALVSFSALTQDALIKAADFKRNTFRINTDFKATNRISFAFDGSLYKNTRLQPSSGSARIFQMLAEIPPLFPAKWSDGMLGEGWNGANPLGYINEGGSSKSHATGVVMNILAKYDFTDWLSVEFRYAPKYTSSYSTRMSKSYTYKRLDGSVDTYPTGRNSLSNSYGKTMENFYQAILRYNKTFGDHNTSATIGYEALDNHYDGFSAARENFLLPEYEVLSGGDENYDSNSGDAREYSLLSYLSRINYDYKSKYLIEMNLRFDGSSRFAKNNRWGTFPSFSVGWRISEENFMNNLQVITNLKIRASWGRLGNQNIGYYPYQSVISINSPTNTVPYSFGNTPVIGAAQTTLANKDVKWETTEDLNFGVDFGLFNNKFSGSFDFYKKNTYDILYIRDIPAVIGLEPSEQNVAEVQNIGWDVQLYWRDRVGNLNYSIDFVLSDVNNKVIDLAGKPQYGRRVIFEDEEFQAYYGYECIGIYRSEADLAKYPALYSNVTIGDLIFKDLNDDGIIDETNDKKIIGSSIPRFNYGLTVNLEYKGFDVSMFFQGVAKQNLYYNVFTSQFGGNYFKYQLGRLIPDDPSTWETADWPRLIEGDASTSNNQDNSFHIYNAAYLRCKNVRLGYNVPETIIGRIGIEGLYLYLTGQNLFKIDRLKKFSIDPEAPDVYQVGTNYYPNTKTIALGVDITF